MSEFASGRHSNAVCDICSVRCEYNELREIYRAGLPTNLLACNYCWDKDHPQLFLGRKPVRDPQTLRRARPDPSLLESRQFFERFGIIQPPIDVEMGGIFADTWATDNCTRTFNAIPSFYGDARPSNLLVENTATSLHGLHKYIPVVGANDVTTSIIIKAATADREYFAIRVQDGAATNAYTDIYDHHTGTFVGLGFSAGAGVFVSRTMTSLGNGWYRITLVCNIGAVGTALCYIVGRDLVSVSYLGDGRNLFYYADEPQLS